MGTAQYLSPEQARGESVDARSDLYSTGCVIFELLTGKPPFGGDSPMAIAYQHVTADAPTASGANGAVPPSFDPVIERSLAKTPADRYQSASEMRADIEALARGAAMVVVNPIPGQESRNSDYLLENGAIGKPVKEVVFTPGGAPAKIDPNGKYLVESMYVQYFTPATVKAKYPLLMWHGGGLTGVTYETTPDGREGWAHFFIRNGWKTYVSDAVERGRSGWASSDIWPSPAQFLPIENPWNRFRMGAKPWSDDPAKREQYAEGQFPPEGYLNFMRQVVPRWTTTDDAIIRAYTELVDKVGPCVVQIGRAHV